MADEIRLPLAMPTEPRAASLDKDSILTNCAIEASKTGTSYVVKRPGLLFGYAGSTTNFGIYYYNGTVYTIDPDDPATLVGFVPSAPATLVPTPVSYYYELAGDLYGVEPA